MRSRLSRSVSCKNKERQSHHIRFLGSSQPSLRIICLRSAGEDRVDGGRVKHSSHYEPHAKPAGKAKICFIFHCICSREKEGERERCLVGHKDQHIELVHLQNHEVSSSWPYSVTCTIKFLLEGDLRGTAAVFWQKRKRERAKGRHGRAER